MQQAQRNLVEEVAELTESMSETELEEAWRLLAGRVEDRLPEVRWVDLAAGTAADHVSSHGRRRSARSFLKIVGEWRRIVDRLAGEPRRVVDFDQLADSSLKQARIAGEALQQNVLLRDRLAKAIAQDRGQGGSTAGIVKALQNHVGIAHRLERRHRRMYPVVVSNPDTRCLSRRRGDEQHSNGHHPCQD